MSVVLSVENLSKSYRLGTLGSRALRDDVSRWWARFRGRPDPLSPIGEAPLARPHGEPFFALQDVSFKVSRGEVVGIIGPNGAGKSTLLKILSQVTAPTTGRIRLRGRIASLLEVGTGFHPELTGRENVFLNGAILGMRKREISRRFDEILAFSGVEPFVDTPVKRYSSGMRVRLAFAVAAHLESEILVIDEVLAVGDAAFQKQCIGKMESVAGEGRTILFVSHNLTTVSNLCSRSILLDHGTLQFEGDTDAAVMRYLAGMSDSTGGSADLTHVDDRHGPGEFARLSGIELQDAKGTTDVIRHGAAFVVHLRVRVFQRIEAPEVGIVISTLTGHRVMRFVSCWEGLGDPLDEGVYGYRIVVDALKLVPGRYMITPWVKKQRGESDDLIEGALQFAIAPADPTGYAPYFDLYSRAGEVFERSRWTVERAG